MTPLPPALVAALRTPSAAEVARRFEPDPRRWGSAASYVIAVLHGRRPPSARLLAAVGWEWALRPRESGPAAPPCPDPAPDGCGQGSAPPNDPDASGLDQLESYPPNRPED